MGPNYDHVSAMAVLHAYADNGQAEILATVASTKYEGRLPYAQPSVSPCLKVTAMEDELAPGRRVGGDQEA